MATEVLAEVVITGASVLAGNGASAVSLSDSRSSKGGLFS
jgi:hypothetical protein